MLQKSQAIDPNTIQEEKLPQDERTRQALLTGKIIATTIQDTLMVYNPHAAHLFPQYIPLREAILVEEDYGCKYPTLLNLQALPTQQERLQSPAMFCHTVMSALYDLNPQGTAEHLLLAFSHEKYPHQPQQSQQVQVVLDQLRALVKDTYHLHDKRFRPALALAVEAIQMENYPHTDEDIANTVPSGAPRAFYYHLRSAIRDARVLLHWYEVPILYSIKIVAYEGSSTGDRYVVVGTNEHRARVELAAKYAWNRPTSGDVEQWELYANDQHLFTAKRTETNTDLYTLSAEWGSRSLEEIENWTI